MKRLTIKPLLGTKTNCPQNSLSLYEKDHEYKPIFKTHDVGGQNFDLDRERNACAKAYGKDKWSHYGICSYGFIFNAGNPTELIRNGSDTITVDNGCLNIEWDFVGSPDAIWAEAETADRDNVITFGPEVLTTTMQATDSAGKEITDTLTPYSLAIISHRASASQRVSSIKVAIGDDGSIDAALADYLEIDNRQGTYTGIKRIGTSNIYVVAYTDADSDGWLCSISVADDGSLTLIDEWEFEPTVGKFVNVHVINSSIVAVSFNGSGGLAIGTVTIDGSGNLGNSWIDSLVIDAGASYRLMMCHLQGDYYALVWEDRHLATLTIDSSGNISNALVDSEVFDATNGDTPDIKRVSDNICVIVFTGENNDGWAKTFSINDTGIINATPLSSLEFDTVTGFNCTIDWMTGSLWLISYKDADSDGWVKSVTIDESTGAISAVIDSLEFEPTRIASSLDAIKVKSDILALAYDDDDSEMKIVAVHMSDAGNIDAAIDDYLQWSAGGWAGYVGLAIKG